MVFNPGQALGNYRILSQIGSGGMGMVYLAEHPLIGKRVALKVIHGDLSRNKEVISRFFNEARAVNRIGNEHIVEIHDFGQTSDGEHFFIMEYLEGRTLADVLAAERLLHPFRAAHIGAQVASALGAAHANGVIHRDLKPDNVMLVIKLGDPDFVKVLDFGLAKTMVDAKVKVVTAQGVVLGTPQYMSPEACDTGKPIDHRADVYSLGVLLFQMLTGTLPFTGESMGEVLVQQVTRPPPALRAINPSVPPSIEQIVLRCLAKDPGARFQTMQELRDALLDPDRYLASSPPVMPSQPTAPRAIVSPPRTTEVDPVPPAGMPVHVDQRTQFVQDGGVVAAAAGLPPRMPGGPTPAPPIGMVPEMTGPIPAVNATMRIGTPAGHISAPPRPRWPIFAAIAAILIVAAAAVAAMMWSGGGEPAAATATASAAPASASAVTAPTAPVAVDASAPAEANKGASSTAAPDAGKPAEPTARAAPASATVVLVTEPPGATVVDDAGKDIATTPATITVLIDGKPRTFTFRHATARERTKTITVTGDMELAIELPATAVQEKRPVAAGTRPRRTRRKTGTVRPGRPRQAGDDVIVPDFN